MDANDNLTPEEKEWILSIADVIAASSKKIDHIVQKLSYSFSTVHDPDVIKGLYAPLAGCEDFSPDMEKPLSFTSTVHLSKAPTISPSPTCVDLEPIRGSGKP